jgi:hypothetical protein
MSTHKIIRNAAQCRKCGDLIVSQHRHDFVWCKCQSIAVDGGKDYLRRIGNFDQIIELSEVNDVPEKRKNDAHLCDND